MTTTPKPVQDDLEALAQGILAQKGVHATCVLARYLPSVRSYRAELERVRAKGSDESILRLAASHVGQFQGLLRESLRTTEKDLQFFRDNAVALSEAIFAGKDYSFTDWNNGWEWNPHVVDVGGTLVEVHHEGFGSYRGQNGRPLVTPEFFN